MIIIYEFYADLFFFQNFLMDAIALFVAAEVKKELSRTRCLRILASSAAGSALSLGLLLTLRSYLLFTVCSYALLFPFTVWLAFGGKGLRRLAGNCAVSLAATVFLGGILEAAEQTGRVSRFFLLIALFAAILALALIRSFYGSLQKQKHRYPAMLSHKGRTIRCMALYDSGNFLKEPYEKKPVQIVSEELLDRLLDPKEQAPRLVPYHALGTEDGLLEVYTLELLCIRKGKETLRFSQAAVGKGEKGLFENKDYQVILNQNLWEMKGMDYAKGTFAHMEKAADVDLDRPKGGRDFLHRRSGRSAAAAEIGGGKRVLKGAGGAGFERGEKPVDRA